ncbi:MAG: extracellular solute-binding protein [Lachnospiraceae bacterium]|nr:extracellular solute-binding protein [Lachnospiraceae bacterium]MDE6184961.1 extracellular solute-binding protein [Lachnospiraceae bacterium]
MKKKSILKKLSLLTACALTLGSLFGCSQNTAAEESSQPTSTSGETSADDNQTTSAENQTSEQESIVVTAWHDNDEAMMNALAEVVNKALAEENITLRFEKKSDVAGQIRLYGTDAANGPDLYLFAHDSLGGFAEMGILEPVENLIDPAKEADLLPMTLEAATYKDVQYLMPVYYETLLFMYNKDLWEGELPSTTDELYDYMTAHTDTAAGTYALVNQHSTSYNVAPFINGFGGYIIDKDANPGLDTQEMKDAITYNSKFAALQADGDYNTVTTLFNEGKAAAIIGGPWLISGIHDAGINLGIKSLSDFTLPNGNVMMPYSGVQCLGVLKVAAQTKKEAIAKVLEVLTQPEAGIMLAQNFNCAPANSKAYEDAQVAANEMILAMEKTAINAVPMPNIPEMSVMWGPAESLLAAVNKSGEDVDSAASKYQQEALNAIADMQ